MLKYFGLDFDYWKNNGLSKVQKIVYHIYIFLSNNVHLIYGIFLQNVWNVATLMIDQYYASTNNYTKFSKLLH